MTADPDSFSRHDAARRGSAEVERFRQTMHGLRLLFAAGVVVSLLMVLLLTL